MTETRLPSSSDDRTENNSTRQVYRLLSEVERAQIDQVKATGDALIAQLHEIGGTDPQGERMASRDLALALTHIEDGVMRAVRHITS